MNSAVLLYESSLIEKNSKNVLTITSEFWRKQPLFLRRRRIFQYVEALLLEAAQHGDSMSVESRE